MNDEDNAARILARYGGDLIYVTGKGWAVWDGNRYSFRSGPLAAREIGHKLRALVLEEAEYVEGNFQASEDEIGAFIGEMMRKRPPVIVRENTDALRMMGFAAALPLRKHAEKCGNIAKIKSALEVCEYQRRVEIADMDSDPWIFVCPNGDLDLRAANEFQPREASVEQAASWLKTKGRKNLPTKCGGVPFKPGAECPNWEAFIALIMPDPDTRACLQRCLGATLFGENRAQVALIMRGPGGNGKSTLLNALSNVLGDHDGYAAPCKIEMFLETGHIQPGAANPEEMDLPGARAYIATEPGARDVLSMKKIKGLVGGDRRMSRGLFEGAFFWKPHGIPILSCNRTPKIKDEDEGTRRRLIFLPFDVNLRALPADKQRAQGEVEAELRAEGSGILNWLIAGFQDFMHQGISPPAQMLSLKEALLEAGDPVGVYIKEMCALEPSGRLNVTDFYKVYVSWCQEEGRTEYQMKTVGDLMVEKGFERGKVMGKSCWKGLKWSENAADLVQDVLGFRPDTGPPIVDDCPFPPVN